jgi:hypothetical protein
VMAWRSVPPRPRVHSYGAVEPDGTVLVLALFVVSQVVHVSWRLGTLEDAAAFQVAQRCDLIERGGPPALTNLPFLPGRMPVHARLKATNRGWSVSEIRPVRGKCAAGRGSA